jgi:ubiquinone/menaquinone biosynthesis C-methylase UbiE
MTHRRGAKRRVEKQYAKVATEGLPDDLGGSDPAHRLRRMGYSDQEIAGVPESSLVGLGCGNPTALVGLKEGETVLDIGSGAGLDAFLAARRVGPKGKVIGVDMTAEMVERARRAAQEAGYQNVEFRRGEMESLPLDDESVDVIISNCVMNHAPDKVAAFRETWRVLRPTGRIHVADLVTKGRLPPAGTPGLEVWAEWLAVAAGKQEYLEAIRKAGFREIAVVEEGPFDSPAMKGPLLGKIISVRVTAYKQGAVS